MRTRIEDEYKSLKQKEQILHRPGYVIGSTTLTEYKNIPIFADDHFEVKNIEAVPALLKLIDEIITNSIDEHIKTLNIGYRDWLLNNIIVNISEDGTCVIEDNGGIFVVKHKGENMLLPEMLFSKLNTSSNYDDTVERNVSGTNGLGAVLVNIFSKSFSVETCDSVKKYKNTWSDNLNVFGKAKTTSSKKHYTKVTFKLDLERLGLSCIDYGTMKLIERRCILGAAPHPKLKITFNNNTFNFKTFTEYVNLYSDNYIYEENEKFNIAVVPNVEGGNVFGIVNGSICNNGTHVEHAKAFIKDSILSGIKGVDKLDARVVNGQYDLFINMICDKPRYDSQTKECLVNKPTELFLTKEEPKYSNKFKIKLAKSIIVKQINDFLNSKQNKLDTKLLNDVDKELKSKNKRQIEKLIDCTASPSQRKNAVLYLYEGDSAMSGFRSSRDAKKHGAYTLGGKVKNTVDVSTIELIKSKSIKKTKQVFNDIVCTLGLQYGKSVDVKKLRYGKIYIATDADVDGYSIAVGIIGFFVIHFPEIVDNGMLYLLKTPIVKATKGNSVKYFYDLTSYKKAKDIKGYNTKYIKGLGSLNKTDYREMIQNPKLEQITVDANDVKNLKGWMGDDSHYRKQKMLGSI